MSDYYEYHATVRLSRPVVLIGFPGADYRQVGRDTSSLTGLPFVDVDQWVEHEAGQSLVTLLLERGQETLESAQARMTEKALRSQPSGIIVLGGAGDFEPAALEQSLDQAFVVYCKQTLLHAYWALRRRAQERGGLALPGLMQPLERIEQLRPLFELRKAGYERAHHTIDMAETGIEGAVRQLMGTLPAASDEPLLRILK